MIRLIKISTIISVILSLIACSGSKPEEESLVTFSDPALQEQVDQLRDKIDDEPNNMPLRHQLATVYNQNGESLEAMRTLERGFTVDPSNAENKYLYAEIALSLGDRKKAYQAYKDVLQSLNGNEYLDRIAPMFTDAFKVSAIISSSADEAFGNFSNDGSKIIYQTNQNGNWDIYEYSLTDQFSKQLTFSAADEENPDYSPDGNFFVYTPTKDDHRDVDYDQKLRDIFKYDIVNKKEWNLTTNGSNDWRPRYSADGKYIAFVSERNDLRDVPFYELHGDVFVMEYDGRFQITLSDTNSNNGSPCIKPGSTEDNGTVYFDSDRSGKYEIYKTDFKREDTRQITFNPGSNDLGPDISSDGEKIVFFSDRSGNFEIFIMNEDGSEQQKLTSNQADDLNPVFSPDGSKVLFHSNRNGNYDLYMIDLTQQNSSPSTLDVVNNIDRVLETL